MLSHILGVELPNPSMIDESVVIVGNDLTPSDTAQLIKNSYKVLLQTLAEEQVTLRL